MLAFGTQVHGFKPGRSRRIFQGKKILSTPSFGKEVKPFVPCRIFAACKRTRKCMRGSRSFRSKLPAISRPSSSSFHYKGLWWRHLAVHVGTTKDQGLYNKPSAAVHPGALATGTLPHTYKTPVGNGVVRIVCVRARPYVEQYLLHLREIHGNHDLFNSRFSNFYSQQRPACCTGCFSFVGA